MLAEKKCILLPKHDLSIKTFAAPIRRTAEIGPSCPFGRRQGPEPHTSYQSLEKRFLNQVKEPKTNQNRLNQESYSGENNAGFDFLAL